MDTKSKNSHKRGIIITVILLAFCSVMMLSQYDSIREAVETAPTAYEASFFRYTQGEQHRTGSGGRELSGI